MVEVLPRSVWEPRARAHAQRVDAATAGRRERAARGATHAIDDFMYDYYGTQPRRLRRWHPGPGIVLEDATEHGSWRWYASDAGAASLDVPAWWADRGRAVGLIRTILERTAGREAHVGCFGMHEWAMVYRQDDPLRRHSLPLRLGRDGTDDVVEAHPLTCTHFDAFRFFTPQAMPLNAHALTRGTQPDMEQPGCLHATMDLYKWALKLMPAIPSELVMDCFEQAVRVREVDMRASPYDVSSYGLTPIAVETPEGKAEYARLQRGFSADGQQLRARLLDALSVIERQHHAVAA